MHYIALLSYIYACDDYRIVLQFFNHDFLFRKMTRELEGILLSNRIFLVQELVDLRRHTTKNRFAKFLNMCRKIMHCILRAC